MSYLPKASKALKPRSKQVTQIAIIYAGILAIMAVAQLFTFDEFVRLIHSFYLPVSSQTEALLAPLIVACEVFAIPFLLRMHLSVAFRWFSMMLGWVVAGLWLYISLSTVSMYPVVSTVGFFGTAIELSPGWWAVSMSVLFGVMAAWASWGMWPGGISKK